MINYQELGLIFIVAVLFVLLFKVQKMISPQNYFSNAQYIVEKDVTCTMQVVRYFYILTFALIGSFLINSRFIVVAGVALGAFLIIWPALIVPSEVYSDLGFITLKDKVGIYIIHLFFVISCILTAYFATIFLPLLKIILIGYKEDALSEFLKWFICSLIPNPLERKFKENKNKRIINNNELIDPDE